MESSVVKSFSDQLSHDELCNELKNSGPDINELSALHLQLVKDYYGDVLRQANASFWCAVVFAGLGFCVLAYSIWVTMYTSIGLGLIGVVSGGLVEFISAIVFFVYKRATEQFNTFHVCLERVHRYLIAFILDGKIEDKSERDKARHDLACIIADAPMILDKNTNPAPRTNRTTRPPEAP